MAFLVNPWSHTHRCLVWRLVVEPHSLRPPPGPGLALRLLLVQGLVHVLLVCQVQQQGRGLSPTLAPPQRPVDALLGLQAPPVLDNGDHDVQH